VSGKPEWLSSNVFSGGGARLKVLSNSLRASLAKAAAFTLEADLREHILQPLRDFILLASGDQIVLHDTHAVAYLHHLKPALTGTPASTKRVTEVTPLQVALIIELKVGGDLSSDDILGQIVDYAMEVAKSRAVDGPVTVAVMNATGIRFLRVGDYRATWVWLTELHSWSDTTAVGGVAKLLQYVLECTNELRTRPVAPWSEKYTAVECLGAGISARVLSARPVGKLDSPMVVIKVFDSDITSRASLAATQSPTHTRSGRHYSTVHVAPLPFTLTDDSASVDGCAIGAAAGAGDAVSGRVETSGTGRGKCQ
jgi:hypothetical protein